MNSMTIKISLLAFHTKNFSKSQMVARIVDYIIYFEIFLIEPIFNQIINML